MRLKEVLEGRGVGSKKGLMVKGDNSKGGERGRTLEFVGD